MPTVLVFRPDIRTRSPKTFGWGARPFVPSLCVRKSSSATASSPYAKEIADGPVVSPSPTSTTEASLVRTGTTLPLEGIQTISPVMPEQYCVVPAPSVDGPVAQLDLPTG